MPTLRHRVLKIVGESGLWRGIGKLHAVLYRWSGGRVGQNAGGLAHLLLTTVGRKSGVSRTVPLTYMPEADRFVLVASNGGADRHPGWWLNLQHTPRATIQVGGDVHEVEAARATPEERAALWPKVKAYNPFYGVYEQITARDIPLVILRPTGGR